jgi:hypothetical protein
MTYDVLAVFENGEENYPLYPSLNNDIVIVPEAGDGPLGQALRVTKVIVRRKVGNGYKKVTETKDIAFDVWVTDSRVILYCKKFEKGGGWVGFGLGGLAVAAVANSVSMAVAASRRKGKALVGNVRYPWISSVMFAPRNGFGTEEQLRLCFVDGTDSSRPDCDVTLYLARGSDSNRIARTIVDRIIAARYASGEEMDADELARFEALRSSGLASPPQKGSLAPYKIPTSWNVPGGLGLTSGSPSADGPTPFFAKPAVDISFTPEAAFPVADVPISVTTFSLPTATFCESCGSAEVGANFCTDCGAAISAPAFSPLGEPPLEVEARTGR